MALSVQRFLHCINHQYVMMECRRHRGTPGAGEPQTADRKRGTPGTPVQCRVAQEGRGSDEATVSVGPLGMGTGAATPDVAAIGQQLRR
jgi:hypothetical protein